MRRVDTKRRSGARTVAVAAAIVTALCTPPPIASANVPPGRIISLIPSDDEVSQFVGVPVRHTDDPLPVRPRGPDHFDQRDECRSLLYINTVDVWGAEYSAFRSQNWTDPSDPDRIFVNQTVGTFATAADARDRFGAVYNPNLFNNCSHGDFHGPPMQNGVTLELYDFKITDNVMVWTMAFKNWGRYTGGNGVHVAFRVGNVISISNVEQQGNPSPAVQRLANHILSRVG